MELPVEAPILGRSVLSKGNQELILLLLLNRGFIFTAGLLESHSEEQGFSHNLVAEDTDLRTPVSTVLEISM